MLMVCVGIVGRWHFNAENVGKRYIAFVTYVMISVISHLNFID